MVVLLYSNVVGVGNVAIDVMLALVCVVVMNDDVVIVNVHACVDDVVGDVDVVRVVDGNNTSYCVTVGCVVHVDDVDVTVVIDCGFNGYGCELSIVNGVVDDHGDMHIVM